MHWIDLLYYFGWLALTPGLVIGIWRIAVGPTTLDRMLGVDLLTITVVALLTIVSLREGTADYVELILIVMALGFFTTVAFFYYLSQLPPTDGELLTETTEEKR